MEKEILSKLNSLNQFFTHLNVNFDLRKTNENWKDLNGIKMILFLFAFSRWKRTNNCLIWSNFATKLYYNRVQKLQMSSKLWNHSHSYLAMENIHSYLRSRILQLKRAVQIIQRMRRYFTQAQYIKFQNRKFVLYNITKRIPKKIIHFYQRTIP